MNITLRICWSLSTIIVIYLLTQNNLVYMNKKIMMSAYFWWILHDYFFFKTEILFFNKSYNCPLEYIAERNTWIKVSIICDPNEYIDALQSKLIWSNLQCLVSGVLFLDSRIFRREGSSTKNYHYDFQVNV